MSTENSMALALRETPSLAEVSSTLDKLVEDGALDALGEGRAQAEAYAAYECRQGAADRANYFGRIKVMAEAALVAIDLRTTRWGGAGRSSGRGGAPFVVAGEEVCGYERTQWRVLGQARIQGLLDQVMRDLDAHDLPVTTPYAVPAARKAGAGWVAAEPVRVAARRLVDQGWTRGRIAEEAGTTPAVLYKLLNAKAKRCSYDTARALAPVVGLDLAKVAPAPWVRSQRRRGRRLRPGRRLKGGRWDEAYVRHRRTMEEIHAVTGEAGDPDLWRALHEVDDFLKRRV